jgi:hypothetical protein
MRTGSETGLTTGEWAVFWAISLLNLIPVWAFRYFPGQDTANHLYAVEIIRVLLSGGAPRAVAETFAANLAPQSNVLFHVFMLGLDRLGISLDLAHRLILSGYALGFPLAGLFCVRAATGRCPVLALLLLPLVWNWFALQGLYNYVLSLVPALVWLGIVARDGGRLRPRVAVMLGLAAVAVYLAHTGTFVALLCVTVVRVVRPADGSKLSLSERLGSAGSLACALAPAGALAASTFDRIFAANAPAEATVSRLEMCGLLEAAGAFFVEFAMRYHIWELAILGPALVLLMAIPLAAARAERRRPVALGTTERAPDRRAPRWPLHAALLLATLYFALPHITFGSDLSPRLRPLIVFCLLCYAGVRLSARARRLVVLLTVASGTIGAAALCFECKTFNRSLDDFASGIPFVREGSRLYPMVFDERGASVLVRPFLHAWGYYGVSRHVVTPFAFAWHETRFPYRYRELPLHELGSRLPSDGEDEPYALVQGRQCEAIRRFSPSLTCAEIRANTESRLATLGGEYDYVLTWAAPSDFATLLDARGYRLLHSQGNLALYESPRGRLAE